MSRYRDMSRIQMIATGSAQSLPPAGWGNRPAPAAAVGQVRHGSDKSMSNVKSMQCHSRASLSTAVRRDPGPCDPCHGASQPE